MASQERGHLCIAMADLCWCKAEPNTILYSNYPPIKNKLILKSQFLYLHSSLQFSRSVVSDSLRPHGPQHARPPCPSPTPGVHSNSCPLSRWHHPAISSSVVPFSSCLQSFPASGSFQPYTLNSINCTSQEAAALKVPSCKLLLYSSLLKITMLLGLALTNKQKYENIYKKKAGLQPPFTSQSLPWNSFIKKCLIEKFLDLYIIYSY